MTFLQRHKAIILENSSHQYSCKNQPTTTTDTFGIIQTLQISHKPVQVRQLLGHLRNIFKYSHTNSKKVFDSIEHLFSLFFRHIRMI